MYCTFLGEAHLVKAVQLQKPYCCASVVCGRNCVLYLYLSYVCAQELLVSKSFWSECPHISSKSYPPFSVQSTSTFINHDQFQNIEHTPQFQKKTLSCLLCLLLSSEWKICSRPTLLYIPSIQNLFLREPFHALINVLYP